MKFEHPIHIAAYQGDRKEVNDLICKHKVDPYIPVARFTDYSGSIILHCAALGGHIAIIHDLVHQHHIDINTKNHYNQTVLHLAVEQGNRQLMCDLLNHYQLPLQGTSSTEDKAYIHKFRKKTLNINARDSFGATALLYACQGNAYTLAYDLITRYQADVSISDYRGNLPITIARMDNYRKLVDTILSIDPKQATAPGENGNTPLHNAAAMRSNFPVVRDLIEKYHVDPAIRNHLGATPLHQACGSRFSTRYLIETCGLDVETKDYQGCTPLLTTAKHGPYEGFLHLIHHYQADIHARDNQGWGAIHHATTLYGRDMLNLLIDYHRLDPYQKTHKGYTALHCAALHGRRSAIKDLLHQHKMDVNVGDYQDHTPLHIMIKQGHERWVRLLYPYQVDMHAKTKQGWNALHFAVTTCSYHFVSELISDHGLDPYACTEAGDTALHIAAQHGQIANAKTLVKKHKMDLQIKNKAGKTPLDLAVESGYHDVAPILQQGKSMHLL